MGRARRRSDVGTRTVRPTAPMWTRRRWSAPVVMRWRRPAPVVTPWRSIVPVARSARPPPHPQRHRRRAVVVRRRRAVVTGRDHGGFVAGIGHRRTRLIRLDRYGHTAAQQRQRGRQRTCAPGAGNPHRMPTNHSSCSLAGRLATPKGAMARQPSDDVQTPFGPTTFPLPRRLTCQSKPPVSVNPRPPARPLHARRTNRHGAPPPAGCAPRR